MSIGQAGRKRNGEATSERIAIRARLLTFPDMRYALLTTEYFLFGSSGENPLGALSPSPSSSASTIDLSLSATGRGLPRTTVWRFFTRGRSLT